MTDQRMHHGADDVSHLEVDLVDPEEEAAVQRLIEQRAAEAPTRTFPPVSVVRDVRAAAVALDDAGDDPCPLG